MYFAALLALTDDGWVASDTEIDDVETLADLADLARARSVDDGTVLAYVEQEDGWFGIVRVDGEEDPRVYVSDAAAAARSSYGELLLTDELLGREPEDLDELVDLDGTEEGEPEAEDDDEVPDTAVVEAGPVGDARLLEDLGVSEKALLGIESDPLSELADTLGCADILEVVR